MSDLRDTLLHNIKKAIEEACATGYLARVVLRAIEGELGPLDDLKSAMQLNTLGIEVMAAASKMEIKQYTLDGQLVDPPPVPQPIEDRPEEGLLWYYRVQGKWTFCSRCQGWESLTLDDLKGVVDNEPRAFIRDGYLIVQADCRAEADELAADLVADWHDLEKVHEFEGTLWAYGLHGNLPQAQIAERWNS